MHETKRVFWEGAIIAVVSVGIAFVANASNPDGLQLSRNYFGRTERPVTQPSSAAVATAVASSADPTPATQAVADAWMVPQVKALLKQYDLQAIKPEEVHAAFKDPLYNATIFIIDARNDGDYLAGHIPGALQLDYYHPERYIEQVMAQIAGAEKIIVYCNGGDCEDSAMGADYLRRHGIDPSKLFVDVGGMEEWKKASMPVERGARGSNDFVEVAQ